MKSGKSVLLALFTLLFSPVTLAQAQTIDHCWLGEDIRANCDLRTLADESLHFYAGQRWRLNS